MKTKTDTEKLQEEFRYTLSKLSHEIRNPVALISSELQLMGTSHPEIKDYNGWDHILDNLEYIKELLNELSRYNNAAGLTLRPTALPAFLNTVIASVKPTLDYLGITLEAEISPDLPEFPIDRIKMRQALLNLLRNAQEAIGHSQGKITVHAGVLENHIFITVTDNGCGMTVKQKKSIFTPFVTFKPGGTGLGLAITRQIIEAHGGDIQADSTPGEGSSFHIFLG